MFTGAATAQTKSLKLYYIHTGEKATITYKKNGRYLASGLKKINWHLRDWRRNEPTKMDPQLLDLVWEAYRQSGSRGYITVISGYRAPASNNLLRKRGRGVAKNSQHTKGKALDFFLSDIKLSKLREIGLKMGVGGVGYYPKSGSPFVHFDTGNVRHWPRMTRKQLARVFPRGDTMHVPTDGKPLARYQQAVAAYKRKKTKGTLVPEQRGIAGGGLFARLTARNNSDDEEEGKSGNAAPAPRAVATRSATVVAAKSDPTPEAVPEPKPEFASLPQRVPVPTLAPRNDGIDTGTQIAVAVVEPQPALDTTPVLSPAETDTEADRARTNEETVLAASEDPAIADAETGQTLENSETAETALASLLVPIPEPRPDSNPLAGTSPDTPPQPAEITSITALALVDPSGEVADRNDLVAALSPSEIEDLRSRVRSTIGATGNTQLPAGPVPAKGLTEAATTQVPERTAQVSDMVVAALEPATPVVTPEPVIIQETEAKTEMVPEAVAADPIAIEPIGIEPGTKKTGDLPIPSRNPAVPEETVLAAKEDDAKAETQEASGAGLTALALASLPVPVRNPMTLEAEAPELVIASLEAPVQPSARQTGITKEVEPDAMPSPALVKRTISLDRYSAPQENSSTLGQFALAGDIKIRDLADVRAPAYGRNVIREVPQTILVQGFNLQPFGPGQNNFSGKAVTAMKFALQRIN